MGGNTPYYGFPYPTGTDRVADGDNAIQSLATAIDIALSDYRLTVSEAPFSVASDWTGSGTARKSGAVVTVTINASKADWIAAAWIAIVPPGFHPPVTTYFAGVLLGTGQPVGLELTADGVLKTLVAEGAGVGVAGSCTFVQSAASAKPGPDEPEAEHKPAPPTEEGNQE
jgi:hypothetical protein